MAKPTRKTVSITGLTQRPETWQLAIRPLSFTVRLEDGSNAEPLLVLLVNAEDSQVEYIQVLPGLPPQPVLVEILFDAIMNPPKELNRKAYRPQTIQFEEHELMQMVEADLKQVGIRTKIGKTNPEIEDLVQSIEENLGPSDEHPEPHGLLAVEGVTPATITALYAAATAYWKAKPWEALEDIQTLKVWFDPPGKEAYIQVMGQGEMEYGIVLYYNWDDVTQVIQNEGSPLEQIPESGWRVLSFDNRDMLPSEDQDAIRKYGWKPVGHKRYLMPLVIHADGVERPDYQELIYYEALMRTLPVLVSKHLVPDALDDYEPFDVTLNTTTQAGPMQLTFSYPAGDLDIFWNDDEDDEEEEIEIPLAPELEKANELMKRAQEETDPQKRIQMAHQALAISPDCVDACILLGDEEADSAEEALAWFERGIQAGERVLGEDFFDEYEGEFWRAPAARAYLRARQSAADMLVELDRETEAIDHYQELVALNWEDHAGARYPLMSLLLKLERNEEAEILLDEYDGDEYAAWAYSRALLLFRQEGNTTAARLELKAAIEQNPHVPAYLSGEKLLPESAPEFTGFGDESEAIHYALEYYPYWWSTPGAIDWLKTNI